jgi:hypothetical protein
VNRHFSHPGVFALALVTLLLPRHSAVRADDWQLLGRRRVGADAERDVIEVGVREGVFDAIRIEVQEGEVEIYNLRIVFGNGLSWSPETRVPIDEGSRGRVIDLPGEARIIRRVEFWYRSQHRRGDATVAVYGRQFHPRGDEAAEVGWDQVGAQQVDVHGEHDVIRAGGTVRYRRIRVVVEGGDLEMSDLKIVFNNGEAFSPPGRLYLREPTRSREIDLPGAGRIIRRIDFSYRRIRGGRFGRTTVHVYGHR